MTDRELLEAAARAAGMAEHRWCEPWKCMAKYSLRGGYRAPVWNPLTDDGDALRLAVKCQLDVYFFSRGAVAEACVGRQIKEEGEDPYAATRRAIVRVAAAMASASAI